MAGTAVLIVAAAGAIALADVEGNDPLGTDVPALLSGLGPAGATPTGQSSGVQSVALAPAQRDALGAAASGRARNLLASRIAGVEQQATAAAAAAAQLTVLRQQCKFNPKVQRTATDDPSQLKNAQTIINVAQQMGLPVRAEVIALATAWQESNLINMTGGDRDSVGLFQQRPSMGWGSYSQVHNPVYAAEQFYDALSAVPGWETMPLTVAAQTVQASAFPWAYARWEQFADNLVAQLTDDTSPTDLNCTPN